MKVVELKVKAKTLAMESKFIKLEEQRAKKEAKWARESQNKERVEKANWRRHWLKEHRIKIIKPEARATHIARSYMKGMSYNEVENKLYYASFIGNINSFYDKVFNMIKKYDSNDHTWEEFMKWIQNHPDIKSLNDTPTLKSFNPNSYKHYKNIIKTRRYTPRKILTNEEREMRKNYYLNKGKK